MPAVGWRESCRQLRTLDGAHWQEEASSPGGPPAREGHSLGSLPGGQLVLFGGRPPSRSPAGAGGGPWFSDLWLHEPTASDSAEGGWHRVSCRGEVPQPRAAHDAHVIVDGSGAACLVVHGGLVRQGYRVNDTWRVALPGETDPCGGWAPTWEELSANEDAPRPVPRFHHVTCTVGGLFVVFGGHNYARRERRDAWALPAGLDTPAAAASWQRVAEGGDQPAPRAYPSLTPPGPRGPLVLFGGSDSIGHRQRDIWLLRRTDDGPEQHHPGAPLCARPTRPPRAGCVRQR